VAGGQGLKAGKGEGREEDGAGKGVGGDSLDAGEVVHRGCISPPPLNICKSRVEKSMNSTDLDAQIDTVTGLAGHLPRVLNSLCSIDNRLS
jgi:hypothetical protein